MDDTSLLRYSRQILLPEIGIEGQQALRDSRVLIVGLGGLGSPVAIYLAAAGVGTLQLVDGDQVDLSNLQRQIVHTTDRIGQDKVGSAKVALQALNPECTIVTCSSIMDETQLAAAAETADLVLDCTDNFSARFAINRACHRARTPLVSGAAIRWDGQVSVFSQQPGSPCYRCLYGESGEPEDSCSENGVAAPLVGIIGSVQAIEAIKVLTGAGEALEGRLLLLDALYMQWRTVKLKPDPACPVCGSS